jgi:hypothetical protein
MTYGTHLSVSSIVSPKSSSSLLTCTRRQWGQAAPLPTPRGEGRPACCANRRQIPLLQRRRREQRRPAPASLPCLPAGGGGLKEMRRHELEAPGQKIELQDARINFCLSESSSGRMGGGNGAPGPGAEPAMEAARAANRPPGRATSGQANRA